MCGEEKQEKLTREELWLSQQDLSQQWPETPGFARDGAKQGRDAQGGTGDDEDDEDDDDTRPGVHSCLLTGLTRIMALLWGF
ncbi:hypothetical protein HGM15179_011924 [Zosterops borbonicus]|uniref:Uncharacterized protein n=1 Tax=Zosterops borbonicus TaxID=364589 RepID=A0A8K1LIT9_9PASS|nr:hypothetical protein HGM15179_011924 [Zosterops borbonicus]